MIMRSSIWFLGAAVLLRMAESRRPRRPRIEGATRTARNLLMSASGAVVLALVEQPITRRLTSSVLRHRLGLLPRLHLPPAIETAAALVLLDYSLYVWHRLNHRVPGLWRFHAVHHEDRELDVTTATRFHVYELLLSVPFRAAQIVVIGVTPAALSLWQTLLLVSVLFHHSNIALPRSLERAIERVLVTPRLHTIHHATRHLHSNWSSGLVLWDMLHGTLCSEVAEEGLVIGVPGRRGA